MSRLVLCEACSRHVRAEAARCPFCDAAIMKRALPSAPGGRARVAMYTALVTCAAIGGACGQPPPPSAPSEGGGTPPSGSSATTPTGTATSASPPSGPKKKEGEVCESDDACASGMKCCNATVCGGRAAQMGNCGPQVSKCVVGSACPVLPSPPYGCVFPDACGGAVV